MTAAPRDPNARPEEGQMSRTDRDPNRGNRRVPISTVSAADLLGLNDDEPCVCGTGFTCLADEHATRPGHGDRRDGEGAA